jgi:hypothetical protein
MNSIKYNVSWHVYNATGPWVRKYMSAWMREYMSAWMREYMSAWMREYVNAWLRESSKVATGGRGQVNYLDIMITWSHHRAVSGTRNVISFPFTHVITPSGSVLSPSNRSTKQHSLTHHFVTLIFISTFPDIRYSKVLQNIKFNFASLTKFK